MGNERESEEVILPRIETELMENDKGQIVGVAGYIRDVNRWEAHELFSLLDHCVTSPNPPRLSLVLSDNTTQRISQAEVADTNALIDRIRRGITLVIVRPVGDSV